MGTLIKDTFTTSISNTETNSEWSFPRGCFTCFGIISAFVWFSSFYHHWRKKKKAENKQKTIHCFNSDYKGEKSNLKKYSTATAAHMPSYRRDRPLQNMLVFGLSSSASTDPKNSTLARMFSISKFTLSFLMDF